MRWGQGGGPGLVLYPYLILQKWGKTANGARIDTIGRWESSCSWCALMMKALVTVRSSQACLCVQDYDSRLHTEGLS